MVGFQHLVDTVYICVQPYMQGVSKPVTDEVKDLDEHCCKKAELVIKFTNIPFRGVMVCRNIFCDHSFFFLL